MTPLTGVYGMVSACATTSRAMSGLAVCLTHIPAPEMVKPL